MKIWRYLDLEKFMSLITTKTLFFNKASLFEDKTEGRAFHFIESIYHRVRILKETKLIEDPVDFLSNDYDFKTILSMLSENIYCIVRDNPRLDSELLKVYLELYQTVVLEKSSNKIDRLNALHNELINPDISDIRTLNLLESININCWHINDHQSNAMWKQYGNTGLAIVSTPEKILASIKKPYNSKIKHDSVEYIHPDGFFDSESQKMKDKVDHLSRNLEEIVFYKNKVYDHEKEYRFILLKRHLDFPDFCCISDNGINLPLDDFNFMEQIVISPYSNDILKSILPKIIQDYNIAVEILKN
jgi:hypothetical protein